jgi:tyrosine-protein phosphatase SIW14
MSENKNAITVSRRSTRLFVEEQQLMEAGIVVHMGYESRYSSGDEKERDRPQREAVTSSSTIKILRMPVVDLGKELCPIFPTTSEDIEKQGMFCLCKYPRAMRSVVLNHKFRIIFTAVIC